MFAKTPAVLHVAVKFLALATALSNATKDAHAFVVFDDVVDHLGEQHGLAHARPAEQARLAAALQGHEHVDDLDAGFKNFGFGGTPRQRRRGLMHGTPFDIGQFGLPVDDVAKYIKHSRENFLAHWRF